MYFGRMPFHRIVVLLAFGMWNMSISVCAQEVGPRFRHITTDDGLSQNSVNDIYEDAFGYMWLATQDGLNRYDGYGFKVYRPNPKDTWAISDNFVTAIYPADSGNLFISTRYGLNYFDRKTERFHKLNAPDSLPSNQPTDVYYWQGSWWAIFHSMEFRLPAKPTRYTDTLVAAGPRTDTLFAACNCHDRLFRQELGQISMQAVDVRLAFRVERGGYPQTKPGVVCTETGALIAYYNTVYKFDASQGGIEALFQLDSGIIQAVFQENANRIWIGASNGIHIVENGKRVAKIDHEPDNPTGLSYPLISAIYRDRFGSIWVGTANGGVNLIPAGSENFRHLSAEHGLLDNQVWSAFQDGHGALWVGTETGLSVYADEEAKASYATVLANLKGKRVTAIAEDDLGQLWIGTSGNGMFIANADRTHTQRIVMPGPNIYAQSLSCFQPDGDRMWVGTHRQAHLFNLQGEHIETLDSNLAQNLSYILSMHKSGDLLYIGTGIGLNIFNTIDHTLKTYWHEPGAGNKAPNFQFITNMAEDENGHIWCATFGGGINRFDPRTETFEFFGRDHGLSNAVLAGLIEHNGALWVSSNAGISRFDPESNSFSNYGTRDGLPFPEFSLGCSGKLNDGGIFFGGTKGLVHFTPEAIEAKLFNETPLLSEIAINYKTRVFDHHLTENVQTLTLKPKDAVVGFRFLVTDVLHASDLRYAYKMEGFDPDWVVTTANDRHASYSNLPAGSYVFKVKAADQNGVWSKNELAVDVTVIPPIWQRWWFILLCGFTVLAVVVAIVRFFSQLQMKRKLREMEMKHRIHQERERISMDLHDHVGVQITYLISNLDRLGIQEQAESGNVRGLGKYAREAMRELRDTVWAIRKDTMTLGEIKQRIQQFGNALFSETSTRFDLTFHADEALILEPAPALHLLRILQEALHNVVKHAQADKVEIRFSKGENELRIQIKDNGRGFGQDTFDEDEHNGLRNMRERASEINALFSVQSSIGEGTTISIAIPS